MKSCFFTGTKRKKIDMYNSFSEQINHTKPAVILLIKKFRDGEIAVAYKEGNVNGQRGNNIIHRIIAKRYKNQNSIYIDESNRHEYKGHSLVRLNERWYIYDHQTDNYFKPEPYQKYAFVTMPDRAIRIAFNGSSSTVHSVLSDNAPYVRYAGEFFFDENQLIYIWNNQSGGYCPPPFLAFQAGLNDGVTRFVAKYDRNDPDMQLSQAFKNQLTSR